MIQCHAQSPDVDRCPAEATCALLDDDDCLRLVCPEHWEKPAPGYPGRLTDPATWPDLLSERVIRAVFYRLLRRASEASGAWEMRQGKTRCSLPAEDLAERVQRVEHLARGLTGLLNATRRPL